MQSTKKCTRCRSEISRLSLLACCLLMLLTSGNAQQRADEFVTNYLENKKAVLLFPADELHLATQDTAATAARYAEQLLQLTPGCLRFDAIAASPVGTHITLSQWHKGLPVYRAGCRLNIAANGRMLSVLSTCEPTHTWPKVTAADSGMVWVCAGYQPTLAYLAVSDTQEVLRSADGVLMYADNRSRYSHGKDTVVPCLLFNPDPLSTAGVMYGSPYTDSADLNTAALNNQRKQVSLVLKWSSDTFYFENEFAVIRKISPQQVYNLYASPTMPTPGRGDADFEGLNVLYHLHAWGSYVHGLGFTSIAIKPVPADPHGLAADESKFTYLGAERVLMFGDGGVDDAEDADVIVHEYNHYLIDDCSPGTSVGFERKSLDEGSCDYFAASYSAGLATFGSGQVFNWDGHNPFWKGRVVNSAKTYPDSIETTSIHRTGQLWSSCLFSLQADLGASTTCKLLYAAYFSAGMNLSMPHMARLMMQADSLLYGYTHRTQLCQQFSSRGLLNGNCEIQELPKDSFYLTGEDGFLDGSRPMLLTTGETVQMQLISMDGRIISSGQLSPGIHQLAPAGLASGVYVLQVQGSGCTVVKQLIRVRND